MKKKKPTIFQMKLVHVKWPPATEETVDTVDLGVLLVEIRDSQFC